ncbi:MAG: tRNA adenosine deaminase-associated protein [Corynebacterium sp.]|uniref:tRNA adenosine deaminase-associated protein n=1 Tax=Corynebacterium sp. TaxID=1720 RepID=UPI00264A0EAA|nr:tRNA adenosine deaminase-associated protein [Corynebacterium sp.]MDN5722967.1 tRNA adenosine deaminase-associated protein [Corynebacterium sp.]MDN6281584.1 tRNA adenosine deaminase-associated protein [Corynebacterium sp.]MDN6305123.1 tRNA adenosine deaminase-associated protein [Corynebacterium sp.]MDN6352935.1 tRNA adenosine deaminase-associated protein [Corynebacterium sp.]MDN6367356.1 tRNA adenosine deaminase-associated protein [Corynebacterium sp.]
MNGFVIAAQLTEGGAGDYSADGADGAAAYGGAAQWRVRVLKRSVPDGLESLVRDLRALRSAGVLVGMVCVEDDWCALVRPAPGGATMLLGDASVVVEDDDEPGIDLARDILDELDVDGPTDEDIDDADDPDAPWPEGDFDMLSDLGVGEQVVSVIFDDGEILASDQLLRVAEELGFDEELAEVLDDLGYGSDGSDGGGDDDGDGGAW